MYLKLPLNFSFLVAIIDFTRLLLFLHIASKILKYKVILSFRLKLICKF